MGRWIKHIYIFINIFNILFFMLKEHNKNTNVIFFI